VTAIPMAAARHLPHLQSNLNQTNIPVYAYSIIGGPVNFHPYKAGQRIALPCIPSRISTGFPSPCEQFDMAPLDLNELLVVHASATSFALVPNADMEGAGIFYQDLAMIDESLQPRHLDIVVANVEEQWCCRRFNALSRSLESDSHNGQVNHSVENLAVQGVVPHSIRMHRPLAVQLEPIQKMPLDLNGLLIPSQHKNATFLAWAQGRSMEAVGIFDGDLILIDRKLDYRHGDIVIAVIDQEFTCKVLDKNNSQVVPKSDAPFPSFPFSRLDDLAGVVTHSIRMHRQPVQL